MMAKHNHYLSGAYVNLVHPPEYGPIKMYRPHRLVPEQIEHKLLVSKGTQQYMMNRISSSDSKSVHK